MWFPAPVLPLASCPGIHTALENYDFDWQTFRETVLPAVDVVVLRCDLGYDRFITHDADWISFQANGFLDVLEEGIPSTHHFTICASQQTSDALKAWII